MSKLFTLLLMVFISSCAIQSQQLSDRIDVASSSSIPQSLALSFVNSYDELNIIPDYQADFKAKEVIINRKLNLIRAYAALNNKAFNYSDLVLIPEKVSINNALHFTQAALIHKDSLKAADLYIFENSLNSKYMIYCWSEYTDKVNQKDFDKFLSALISLGVQTKQKELK